MTAPILVTVTPETYRLNEPILSIHSDVERSGQRIPIVIPSGAFVTLPAGPLDGLGLVDVVWGQRTVTMFTVDLRNRATLIRVPKPTARKATA